MNTNNYQKDVLHLIKILDRILSKGFNSHLEKVDISYMQGRILLFIHCSENVIQKMISDFFSLSKSTTSELIHRMCKKDLLIIEKNKSKSYLRITETGNNLINDVKNGRAKMKTQIESSLEPEQLENLKNYLNIIINKIKEGNANVEEN